MNNKVFGYKLTLVLFILPFIILILFFVVIPILVGISMGFMNIPIGKVFGNFVGIDNFKIILNDPIFWNALKNTIELVAAELIVCIVISFLLAVSLTYMGEASRSFFKTFIFIPVILSFPVVCLLWGSIFNYNNGILNAFLKFVHLDNLTTYWLMDSKTAFGCIIFVFVWKYIGLNMVFFYTGIKSIPVSYNEAAIIEGASSFYLIKHITIPLCSETFKIVCILACIGTFGEVQSVMLLTGGGPGTQTYTLAFYNYYIGIVQSNYGIGCASSIVFALIVIAITLLLNKLLAKERIVFN